MAARCLPLLGGRFAAASDRRYARQIVLAEVGGAGQERLHLARPLLVGHGPLAEVAAEYLCRAGVTGLRHLEAPPGPTLFLAKLPADAERPGGPVVYAASQDPLPVLYAASHGPRGEVGLGCPCRLSEPDGLAASTGTGEAAFATGSALALEGLKHLLGLAPRSLLTPTSRLRIDLSPVPAPVPSPSPAPVVIVPAAPCHCGGRALSRRLRLEAS